MSTPEPDSDAPGTASLSAVVLRPVRGHHAFEACVEQLAEAVRIGLFPVGAMLPPERELADRLGVSRATVREAIAALRSAGMARTVRGRGGGTVVQSDRVQPAGPTELSERRDQLLDSLTFRRVVEPGAVYLAATQGLTSGEEELLGQALGDVAAAAGDPVAHRQADTRLHLALATVTRSPMIIDAVAVVQARLHEMLSAIPVLPVNIGHSTAQHNAIVDAVLQGRPAEGRRAMEQHCDDTAALLRGLLGAGGPHDDGGRR